MENNPTLGIKVFLIIKQILNKMLKTLELLLKLWKFATNPLNVKSQNMNLWSHIKGCGVYVYLKIMFQLNTYDSRKR